MQVRCSGCSKTLQVADQHAGKKVKCPCGAILQVPAPTGAAATAQKTAVPKPAASKSAATQSVASRPGAPNPAVRVQAPAARSAPATLAGRVAGSGATGAPVSNRYAPPPTASTGGFDSAEISGLFNELSDADLKAPSPYVYKAPMAIGTSIAGGQIAGQRVQDSEEQKETRAQASKHLFQSLGILIFLGLVRICLYGYFYLNISSEVESLTLAEPDMAENLDWLVTALKVVYGMFVVIGVGFLVCAGLAFQFPMTATITALVLYILSEIVGFVTAPWTLLSIRGWIIKAAIFGGLVQAINNASYYKFVKNGGRS